MKNDERGVGWGGGDILWQCDDNGDNGDDGGDDADGTVPDGRGPLVGS